MGMLKIRLNDFACTLEETGLCRIKKSAINYNDLFHDLSAPKYNCINEKLESVTSVPKGVIS